MNLLDHLPEHPAISWVPFHPGHVLGLSDVRSKMFEQHAMVARLEAQAAMGDAITAYLYGQPVACFGYSVIWTGVAEMWLYVDEKARKYGKTITRAGLVFSDYATISANLHRLQISVECDDERAVRWGQALGFEIEGRMRRFGPNQADFFIMSKI
jgi:RimJ/RimL family protein N-acetyltransferase